MNTNTEINKRLEELRDDKLAALRKLLEAELAVLRLGEAFNLDFIEMAREKVTHTSSRILLLNYKGNLDELTQEREIGVKSNATRKDVKKAERSVSKEEEIL